MRAKTPEYRSVVAIVELVDGRLKIRLPETDDGYVIAKELAEKLAGQDGVAILHRKEPKP